MNFTSAAASTILPGAELSNSNHEPTRPHGYEDRYRKAEAIVERMVLVPRRADAVAHADAT